MSLIQDYENEYECKACGENHTRVRYFGRNPEGRNDLWGLEVEECLVICEKDIKWENIDWLPSSTDTVEGSQQRNVCLLKVTYRDLYWINLAQSRHQSWAFVTL